MAAATDKARWVGNAGATLHDGTVLVPGETIVTVNRGEAELSDHWAPIGAKPTKAKAKAKPKQKTQPSESAGTAEGAGAPSETTTAVGGES